ncbi:hypothetical protein F5Y19DRAFT_227422 [Xylariaceae sp. FL1651]|nr:hypothetical protein F5Y19DRAFT_227422 [Xylariaceae sp. FL1651]
MPLKPAVSGLARRIMKSAFDDLESTVTPDDSRGFSSMTLEDLKRTALDIENQLAARQALRNLGRLMPLFNGIEHYSKVVDVLCNGTPYLAWIWAPITLILRVASEYVEAFEHIVKGYSRIAESLDRFEILNKAFVTNMEFQQTLAIFYSDILLFHKNAYKFVRRNSWKLLFFTSWGRFQRRFDNILDDMKRHEKLVDLQANACNISEAREMREEIKTWKEDSLARLQQLNEQESNKQYESIMAWSKADESDQLAIIDAILAESSKFAGTCSWTLKNQKFKAWLQQSSDCSVLWLQGAPGSGKSVLTSQIARFMKTSNLFVVRHFCSQRYSSSILYDQVLRSLLLQLLRKNDELVAHVYKDFVLGKKPPTVQALEKLLLTLLKITSDEPRQTKYIWIIIDGLNECEPRDQISVMTLINQITGKKTAGGDTVCKILISSRHSPTIAKRLRTKQVISLSEERNSVKLAIMQYVSQRLQSLHEKLRQLDLGPKEIEEVVRVITNKADGMFLYARLVLDYLASNIFYSGAEMKSSIDELPRELSDFYQKILTQILVRLDPRSADRLKSIFGWIAFSKRPLKRMEFLSALTFGSEPSTATRLVPSYVLDVCGPLIEERPDTTLTFIHISVKEFLQSPTSTLGITEKDAVIEHCISTVTCLLSGFDYLINGPDRAKAIRIVKGLHGLHVYATEFWTEHLLHHASMGEFNSGSHLFSLVSKLVQRLEDFMTPSAEDGHCLEDTSIDERLTSLKEQPLLLKHVEASLRARSLKRLESKILEEANVISIITQETQSITRCPRKPQTSQGLEYASGKDGISTMLSSYQETARFLLQQDQYPGVSSTDLELWKSQFRTSAFTCRLSFCPRATEGFLSEDLRRQHEMAHTRLTMCTVPDCKYPPFPTVHALKNHLNKYHFYKPARRPIRQPESMATPKVPTSATIAQEESIDSTQLDEGLSPERRDGENQSSTPHSAKSQPRGSDVEKHSLDVQLRESGLLQDTMKASTESSTQHTHYEESLPIDSPFDAVESTYLTIESIGFRACNIIGCSQRLDNGGGSNDLMLHYWNWHHADSIARCSDHRCQMVFSSRECLEAHYEQRHTAFHCNNCLEHDQDGYGLEDELRQHWRSCHTQKVKRWVCDDILRQGQATHAKTFNVPFDSCQSCVNGQKYDRRYDALKHLANVHSYPNEYELGIGEPLLSALQPFVVAVWVYEVEGRREPHKPIDSGMQLWHDSDSEEEVDDMFYVAELA